MKWHTGTLPTEYLEGIRRDAEHHAPAVTEVWMTLVTAAAVYADCWCIHRGKSRDFGKVLWLKIDGVLYTLVYRKPRILLLLGNLRSREVIASFVNGSPVRAIFEALKHEYPHRRRECAVGIARNRPCTHQQTGGISS